MLAILGDSDILFFVMREMTNIEKKIQKLEAKIMLDPKMYSLDPIRNHRIKVRLFNIARGELLEQDLKSQIKKISN